MKGDSFTESPSYFYFIFGTITFILEIILITVIQNTLFQIETSNRIYLG